MSDSWRPEIRVEDGLYYVSSERHAGVTYTVSLNTPTTCNCPDATYRPLHECKHIAAVREFSAVQSQQSSQQPVQQPNDAASQPTPEQDALFAKLAEGAARLAALAPKADALGCHLLASQLKTLALDLGLAVTRQRRVLTDSGASDPFVIEIP